MSLKINIQNDTNPITIEFLYNKGIHLWVCLPNDETSIEMNPDVLPNYIEFLCKKYKHDFIELIISEKNLLIDEIFTITEKRTFTDVIYDLKNILTILYQTIITKYDTTTSFRTNENDTTSSFRTNENDTTSLFRTTENEINDNQLEINERNRNYPYRNYYINPTDNNSETQDDNENDNVRDNESNDEKKYDNLSLDDMKIN